MNLLSFLVSSFPMLCCLERQGAEKAQVLEKKLAKLQSTVNEAMESNLGLSRGATIEKLEACLASSQMCSKALLEESSGDPGHQYNVARRVETECNRALSCLRSHVHINRRRFLEIFIDTRMLERQLGHPETAWPLEPMAQLEQEDVTHSGDVLVSLDMVSVNKEPMMASFELASDRYPSEASEWEDDLVEDSEFSSDCSGYEDIGRHDAADRDADAEGEENAVDAKEDQAPYGNESLVTEFQALTIQHSSHMLEKSQDEEEDKTGVSFLMLATHGVHSDNADSRSGKPQGPLVASSDSEKSTVLADESSSYSGFSEVTSFRNSGPTHLEGDSGQAAQGKQTRLTSRRCPSRFSA
ncbi:hypothetical protein GQ53DRAFT_498798 [Thozetella sp. PMI_491]|nr:hypothetical protein GQ53DRAFT_498798 [Thozetella sp. PMI_491]